MSLVYHGTPRLYPEAGPSLPLQPPPSIAASASPSLLVPGLPSGPARSGAGSPAIVLEGTDGASWNMRGSGMRVAAIRFPKPVRLNSLRIVPAGVRCPLGVGETDDVEFTADIFLHVTPSDPVNAMVRTRATVPAAPHAIDFAMDMPEGTSTRLVVVRAPVDKITMSLYAYNDGANATTAEGTSAIIPTPPTTLPLPSASELLSALASLPARSDLRTRAFKTLALLARTPSLSLADVVVDRGAVDALCVSDDQDADWAVRSVLGLEPDSVISPVPLAEVTEVAPVSAGEALTALTRLPGYARVAEHPSSLSFFSIVLALARAQMRSAHPRAAHALASVLERLAAVSDDEGSTVVGDHLARSLPQLAAHARARGADVALPIPLCKARTVLDVLLPVTSEVTAENTTCAAAARALAEPYLAALGPHDPIRQAWTATSPVPSPCSSGGAQVARALDAPTTSIHLTPTAHDLLEALAPALLVSLSTAPTPPLGLRSKYVVPSGPGTASHYAGKVYSAHEFRRERDTASGLGVGLAAVGRKASRHVDDFMS